MRAMERIEFSVTRDYEGMRLDRFAGKLRKGAPRNLIMRHIRTGAVHLNGKKADAGTRLAAGDIVGMPVFHTVSSGSRTPRQPEEGTRQSAANDLDILSEDENIIALNKPAGLLSQPSEANGDALSARLAAYVKRQSSFNDPLFTAGPAWRLDRNVSGLVLAAKNAAASRELAAAVRGKTFEKIYLALVCGSFPDRASLTDRASKDDRENRMYSGGDGSEQVYMSADYRTIARSGTASLISAVLHTGRTHQIRFQTANAGFPVAGDVKYGGMDRRFARPMLHCLYAVYQSRAYRCPLPEDFRRAVQEMGISLTFSADGMPEGIFG